MQHYESFHTYTKLPRMFFVTDMDDDNASFRQVVENLTEVYGKKIAPFHSPIRESGKFVGFVNVVKIQLLIVTFYSLVHLLQNPLILEQYLLQ